jgi:hypothetical protein
MKKNDTEQEMLQQFAEFVEADPTAPSKETDEVVLRMVAKDLRPALVKVFAKLTLVEVSAGLVTLTLCPQFGLGFGTHNELLHRLHAATPPAVFYLLCGVLFVFLGAAIGGLVLTRHEIRAIGQTRNRYFALYSLLAYVILVTLGTEAFVASSLFWIVGAMLGNFLGYGTVIHLRHAVVWR